MTVLDLVGNPKERFSHDAALMIQEALIRLHRCQVDRNLGCVHKLKQDKINKKHCKNRIFNVPII